MQDYVVSDEQERQAAHTEPFDTVESTLAESVVTATEPPEEPHLEDMPTVPLVAPKRYFRVNWWSIVALLLLLLLAGEHVPTLFVTLVHHYFRPLTTVTIFPTQKRMSETYTFLAVTGTADTAHQQIPSRLLSFTTPPTTVTVKTTGRGKTPPTQATGSVSFYNAANYGQTIDAGTVITGNDGVQVVTDEAVTMSAGNPPYSYGIAQASAHSLQAGTVGNIAPFDMNGLCCLAGIAVKNTVAFTGGADAKQYPMLSQADVDAATTHVAGSLEPFAKDALTAAVKTSEQLLTPITCTSRTVSSPPVGEQATQAQVRVSETCNAQVYDQGILQRVISSKFFPDMLMQAGADFISKGSVAIAIAKTTLLDSRHHTYQLTVIAQGSLQFHLSARQLHALAQQLAGKKLAEAQQALLRLEGVQGVDIQPAGRTQTSLPTDPGQIGIQVMTGS